MSSSQIASTSIDKIVLIPAVQRKKGGGVLIAVKANIRSEEVSLNASSDINCICVRVNIKTGFLYIYVGYLPPKGNDTINNHIESYRRHLESIRSINLNPNDKLLVLGDYNIPGIPWFFDDDLQCYFPTKITGEIADCFLNGMMELGLFQLSNITNKCGNFYASEPLSIQVTRANMSMTAAAENSTSDERLHYSLEWESQLVDCKKNSNPCNAMKCFKKTDFNRINEFWINFDINQITTAPDIDMVERTFHDNMYKCIDKFVPTITPKNYGTNHPPWFDRKLINLKNRKDKARKLIALMGSTDEFDHINNEFITYNNQRIAEYQLEQNYLCRDNPRKFWEYINSHRKTKGYPDFFQYDDKEANNDKDSR